MLCANTVQQVGGFSEIVGDKNNSYSIRYLSTSPGLNSNDLNYGGTTYLNGTVVSNAGGTSVSLPGTHPTGYNIYCFYITGGMRTAITQLCVLGDYASSNRSFNGYAGDVFIGNANFGLAQQQEIEGYLGYKYKCQSLLPSTHPFYSANNSIPVSITAGTYVAPTTIVSSQLSIVAWYSPESVTLTNGYVTAWPDMLGTYSLNNVATGGTGNSLTQVTASGSTYKAIYQSNINGGANWSFVYRTTCPTLYAVMFCANTLQQNGGFSEFLGDKNNSYSIRYLTSSTSLNSNDLNMYGTTYVNGVVVSNSNGTSVSLPTTYPTGYTIYCFYIAGGMRTAITQLSVLGDYATPGRGFSGYAGDVFIGDISFGMVQQQMIEGYLGYKYKCQSSLPTWHPYYSSNNSKAVSLSVG